MPLDNTREYPHQRLFNLKEKLRKGEFTFRWNYASCQTCAMAIDAVFSRTGQWSSSHELAEFYGITDEQAAEIFTGVGSYLRKCQFQVTVEEVVDRIEEVLERVLAH